MLGAVFAAGLLAAPYADAAKLNLSQSSGTVTYEGIQGVVDENDPDPYESSDLEISAAAGRIYFKESGNHPELFTLATAAKSDATHDRCAVESQDTIQAILSCNAAIVHGLNFKLERGEDGLDLSELPATLAPLAISVSAGGEVDTIQGSALPETITGGEGEDDIDAGDGADQITGGPEDGLDDDDPTEFGDGDTIDGEQGADTIDGQGGEDDVDGGSGSDILHGGPRDDYVSGDTDSDSIYGDDGDDSMFAANDDTDLLIDCGDNTGPPFGGDFAEVDEDDLDPTPIRCEDVRNPPPPPPPPPPAATTGTVKVSAGKLTFDAVAHNESIKLASTSNSIIVQAVATNLCCFEYGYDIAVSPTESGGCVAGTNPALDPAAIIRVVCPAAGIDSVQVNSAGETKVADASALDKPLVFNGGNGNDWVTGTPYPDVITTGENVTFGDRIEGRGGADTIDAGPGNDFLDGGADGDKLVGGAGEDQLFGRSGNDTLDGGGDGDALMPGVDSDEVIGGDGADRVEYTDSTAAVKVDLDGKRDDGIKKEDLVRTDVENISGSGFDDMLTGSKGNNAIAGGGGADKLKGGSGNDLLLLLDSPPTLDKGFSCGAGDDSVLLDSADAAKLKVPKSCEHNLGAGPSAAAKRAISTRRSPVIQRSRRCTNVTLMGKYRGCLHDVDGDGMIRISCIGDSNTFWYWTNPNFSWCVRIGQGASSNVQVWTRGGLGAATTPHFDMGTYPGPKQLEDSLGGGRADVVAIAFGTNDIGQGAPPRRVAGAIRHLVLKVERSKLDGAQGRRAIALGVPPKISFGTPASDLAPVFNPKVDQVNARLAKTLLPRQFVAHPQIVHDDLSDGVHMETGGQIKRADAIARALTTYDEHWRATH